MPPEPVKIGLRPAGAADADRIADLHARSWQSAYRGSLSDAYLDGPIAAERQAFWTERMRHPPPGLWTLLAEDGTGLKGFVCALIGHDARWGTLIDNLHADPSLKRQGIGRRLLSALGQHLLDRGSAVPVHLFVLAANRNASAFYARLGGETVERMIKTEPDGSALPADRVAWRSVEAFVAGAG